MSQTDSQEILDQGEVTFTSDSKLLSEIGERLIATSDIALSELIKNAYDADATKCNIWLEEGENQLIIKDDGHGMTETEFRKYWMTIATTSRLEQETSRKYNRELTGAKGVGRFAVRNLGLELELNTVAYYEEYEEYRRLIANFRWGNFESGEALQDEKVNYTIKQASEEDRGTELRIADLQDDWTQEELEEVSGEVLDIISAPYEANRSELDIVGDESEEQDPGFSVYFAPPGKESPTTSAAQEIYERFVCKVQIQIEDDRLTYECEYSYGYDEGEAEYREYEFNLDRNLVGNLAGELRYFNHQYSGLFRGMETIDGRRVSKWLRENAGVRVIDKNFRVPPYGDQGNDWLNISESHARRERRWRSSFVSDLFPDDEVDKEETKQRQLNLPRKNQVLGSIHVSSHRPGEKETETDSPNRLVPAMDRQGFVENEAMDQLVDVARGAIEIIAIIDREEKLRRQKKEVEESVSELKDEIEEQQKQIEDELNSVVDDLDGSDSSSINNSDTNSSTDSHSGNRGSSDSTSGITFDEFRSPKSQSSSETDNIPNSNDTDQSNTSFTATESAAPESTAGDTEQIRKRINEELKPGVRKSYSELKQKVEEYEKAREELRASVESMYLMSAVAAFMTHETSELLRNADEMIESWEEVPKSERSEEFENRLEVTKEAREKFEKQLGYAKRFMSGLKDDNESELYVTGKVNEVVEQFDHYTNKKDIEIERNFPKYLQTPPINPSIYTGVLMNLFTNAVKAVLDVAPENSGRKILFEAENTEEWHKLRVADTGSGIPDGLEDRIFDPLFSTTENRDEDPLGGGVGLGLYVVERVVESSDGEISVVEPPEEFETCFEVRFKR